MMKEIVVKISPESLKGEDNNKWEDGVDFKNHNRRGRGWGL